MQPLKITIFGDFWDCQIYRGRLYLWKMDGKLLVYDWDNFIDSLIEKPSQKLAITCAFSRGDFLYGRSYYELFNNFSEIKNLIRDKFNLISKKTYAFEEKDLWNIYMESNKILLKNFKQIQKFMSINYMLYWKTVCG